MRLTQELHKLGLIKKVNRCFCFKLKSFKCRLKRYDKLIKSIIRVVAHSCLKLQVIQSDMRFNQI